MNQTVCLYPPTMPKTAAIQLSIGTCTVRAPNRFVTMAAGPAPASLRAAARHGTLEANPDLSPEALDWVVRLQKVTLTRCVGPITRPDGAVLSLVDKPLGAVGPEEIALDDLDDTDLGLLIDGIEKLKKEADLSAPAFRPASKGAPEPGHAGSPLPMPAE